jgi:hypothetical protein
MAGAFFGGIIKTMKIIFSKKNTGMISITALVFMAVFVMVLTGLLTTSISQKKVQKSKEQGDQALQIAEAGLDYYKWFLAHYPDDLTDGTGVPGPYVHDYVDPEAGALGKFSLSVGGNLQCGSLARVNISSTGWLDANPSVTKVVSAVYGRPTVGEYSYILDSDVWAGPDRIIYGPYHSNGGIRMDGTNFAQVTSAKTTWNCTGNYGCSPNQPTAPGVVGSGPGSALWSSPVVSIAFNNITLNLGDMKNKTASTTPGVCTVGQTYGCYFAPSGGSNRGYHAKFLSDGRMELYRVTATRSTWEYNSSTGWAQENNLILADTPVAGSPFTLPTSCGMVFVEDKLWVEGTVKGKISIAAADLGAADPDLILSGNIDYTTLDGSDGLLALGENRVLVPLDSPNDMIVRGIFMAQKGYFGRHCFRIGTDGTGCSVNTPCNSGGNNFCRVPVSSPPATSFCGNDYRNCVKRNSMTIYGTVVSSGRVGTKWNCGGSYCSGYSSRTDSYDSKLATDPPPLTPAISDTYKFLEWSQDK